MMLKAYEEYKKSELPWVKKIPSHWRWLRNGILLVNHKERVGDRFSDFELLSLTTKGIKEKDIKDVRGKVPDSYEGYQKVYPGDMVFCLFDLDCSAVFSGLADCKGMITSAYDVATPQENRVSSKYLNYWFDSVFAGRYYKIYSKSVRYTINYDAFKTLKSPIPPKSEQDQIVRYLDWKTSEMNRFIHQKKKQINMLRELKLSLIDNAVTKGIDNEELKESGQAWIGKIPKHWNMEYSKHFFFLRREKARESDEQLTSSQQYGIISQKKFMQVENRRVTVVITGDDILKHVEAGDFVISMRSFQGGIEYSTMGGKISSAYVMLIPNHEFVNDEYFRWLLKSPSYIKALQGTSDLVRDGQALRYSNFAKVYLPKVPTDEQERIADYLNQKIPQIDEAIGEIQKEISLIEELKVKLLSDVVTGQVDVRDEIIPVYEMDSDVDERDDDVDEELSCENIDEE